MRRIALTLALAGIVTSCGSSDDSEFVPPEYSSSITGPITFFSEEGINYIQITGEGELSEDSDATNCPIGMGPELVSYSLNSSLPDSLVLNDQELTRRSTPDPVPSVSGVQPEVFGEWDFPQAPLENGYVSIISAEILAESITYTNSCQFAEDSQG